MGIVFDEMDAMIGKAFVIESRTSAMLAIVGILVFGFYYADGRISVGPLLFLGVLAAALIAVAVVFVRRPCDPDESVEQMRYKTDHPTTSIETIRPPYGDSTLTTSKPTATLRKPGSRTRSKAAVAWVYECAGPSALGYVRHQSLEEHRPSQSSDSQR